MNCIYSHAGANTPNSKMAAQGFSDQDLRGSRIRVCTRTRDFSLALTALSGSTSDIYFFPFFLGSRISKQKEGHGVEKGSASGRSCYTRARAGFSEALRRRTRTHNQAEGFWRHRFAAKLRSSWVFVLHMHICKKVQGNRGFQDRPFFPYNHPSAWRDIF